ncbi:MAG: dipeptidase [Opitutaceae bacterium]|nr:dipeptidase [Opitutaceae bacterium]
MSLTPLDYLAAREDRLVEDLKDFIRIPSQSGTPAKQPDVLRAADWVARRLAAAGLEHVSVCPTGGHPVVYGDWLHAAGAPTVLVYGHYDVQPAEPLHLWTTPAFEPQIRDQKLFGRGASDNKGGVMAAIAAVEAMIACSGRPRVNVKFCIEGEEELGSPSIGAFVKAEANRLACDLVMSADGSMWTADQPQVVLGLRGNFAACLRVWGPSHDLHSGIHGGTVLNPLEALSRMLASLRHPDGRIAIPGFYDDVLELSARDRAAIARVPIDEAAWKSEAGIPAFHGEPGYSPIERTWIRPTVEINGLWGGHQGAGPKTIIPTEAHAKLTCRLVANQEPERMFALLDRHLAAHTPPGVQSSLVAEGGLARPYAIPGDHPANRILTEVLTEVYGAVPYETRTGGSIPVLAMFAESLGAPAVNLGAATPDACVHAPNEFVHLRALHRAARSMARFCERLAAARARGPG